LEDEGPAPITCQKIRDTLCDCMGRRGCATPPPPKTALTAATSQATRVSAFPVRRGSDRFSTRGLWRRCGDDIMRRASYERELDATQPTLRLLQRDLRPSGINLTEHPPCSTSPLATRAHTRRSTGGRAADRWLATASAARARVRIGRRRGYNSACYEDVSSSTTVSTSRRRTEEPAPQS
jgi:hypothetical protein